MTPTVATGHQSVKRGQNRTPSEPDRQASGSRQLWVAHANVWRSTVRPNKPTRVSGLPKTGKAYGAGSSLTDRCSPSLNPVESTTLRLRKTNLRNKVTAPILSVWSITEQAPAEWMRDGGIVQEANARRKASGYADVDTVVWMIEPSVGVHTS
jgi:hypothetical protein